MPVAEADPFADLAPPDDLIGGLGDAPAYQTTGGKFQKVPRAQLNAPATVETDPFGDLQGNVPEQESLLDVGDFHDLVPQPPKPQTESERVLAETPEWVRSLRQSAGTADIVHPPTPERIGPDPNDIQPAGPWSTTLTGIGLPRPFPDKGEGTIEQLANAVFNFPVSAIDFALSPAGVALGTITPALSVPLKKLVAAGFTIDQIRHAATAPDLQSRTEALLGAALATGAFLKIGPKPETTKSEPTKPASEPGAPPATTERLLPQTRQGIESSAVAEGIPEASTVPVKPTGQKKIHEETGLPLNEDGTVTLYHGTTASGAESIRKTNQLRSAGEPSVYLTTEPGGTGYGDGTVVAVRVRPEKLLLDDEFPNGRKDFSVEGKSVPVQLEPKLFQSQKQPVQLPVGQQREVKVQEPAIPSRQNEQIISEPRSPQKSVRESGIASDQPQKQLSYSELTPDRTPSASKLSPVDDLRNRYVDIERRNAQSTEPVIPKEPAGTKFVESEIMSPGPGAASAKETLASYELRRFGKRFQETEGIDPAIREATGNRYYEPIPNKLTLEEAGKIIEERGTDDAIRLVRDENFAMEPRVRATLAQTLVQKLNQSHAEATAAGDATRAKSFLDQAVDTAEYLGEFGTRLGQGVQSFAIWSRLTPEGMLESAKRSAKRANVDLTPEQQAEIRRLAREAHEAKEGIPKQDATKKLANYMVQQTGIPAGDLPLSIYYTHILSGVQTHVVNAVDTGLNVLHEVNNLAVTNPRAAASIYAGLMRGLGEGKSDGLLSLQEGRRIIDGKFIESPDLLESSQFGKKGGVPIAPTSRTARMTKRLAESWPAKPLNAYKYVMRMMSASDAVFFRGAEEARAGLLAHRLAEATGVERAKLKSEVDSILGYDRLPEFRAEAAKEGYTGAKAEARSTELMIQSRPESLRADASDYAGVTTYNHAPRGVLGYLSNQIAQVSNKYPALKLFVPFTRIVANVTNRGLDNTPMGILRALREKGLSAEERQRTLTRGIIGTAGLIGLGVLDATGTIKIHGAGPSDIEKKRQLQNAGWKPFSVQVGDKYFTYTYSPIGLGVSVLGNYLDSQRYNELSQKDSLTRVAYSMSRIGQTVFSQSFLSGLSNLFTILSGDPGRSVNSLKQFFSGVATAATTPNLARDINHLFDPTARKSDNIAQDLIRNIPVARLNLKPTLNAFGEPVQLTRNRFFSGQSDDPAWRLVVNRNLRVPVVDQTIFEDNNDGYNYAKLAGQRMKAYVREYMTELQEATPQQAQDMLSKAARGIFDAAREEIVESGGVRKRKRPAG